MAPIFMDVNIPMYAAGAQHELKAPCAWILEEVVEGRLNVATDAEVVQEVLYRYGALRRWDLGVRIADNLFAILPVIYPFRPEDARTAVELFQRYGPEGVPARDCAHAAVMLNRSIAEILSTDGHFDLIEALTRIDPLSFYADSVGG